jgi:CBS domain-containing protein
MSNKVVTVKATEKVSVALRAMVRHKIGSVIVVDKRKPVGIITERDVSTKLARGQNLRGMLVKTTMSGPLVTVLPSTEISQAVELMVRNDIRRLPVIEGGKLMGMVTERDILRWLVEVEYAPNIPEDLKKLLDARAQAHSFAH